MAATFNWSISLCERNLSDGGITVVHWRCDAEETVGTGDDAVTYHQSSYGTQGLTPDVSADDFIAYDSVTENNVKSWIWAADVNQTEIENGLQAGINLSKAPTTGTGVPW